MSKFKKIVYILVAGVALLVVSLLLFAVYIYFAFIKSFDEAREAGVPTESDYAVIYGSLYLTETVGTLRDGLPIYDLYVKSDVTLASVDDAYLDPNAGIETIRESEYTTLSWVDLKNAMNGSHDYFGGLDFTTEFFDPAPDYNEYAPKKVKSTRKVKMIGKVVKWCDMEYYLMPLLEENPKRRSLFCGDPKTHHVRLPEYLERQSRERQDKNSS